MKKDVIESVKNAIEALMDAWGLENIPAIDVEIPRDESHGDVATTIAMSLARPLRRSPKMIAEEIVKKIMEQPGPFQKVETAGSGFINFTYHNEYYHEKLKKLLKEGHEFFRTDIGQGKKVQVEFVSANPTGPLHIGHGRGAAVGNALCNLLKSAGYEVEREFYVNDAGMQVKLLGLSVYTVYQQMLGNEMPFPENGYKGDYVKDISEEMKLKVSDKYHNIPFKDCSDIFTDFAYKKMLADLARDLREFGIGFDRWQSEKELYDKGAVKDALEHLKKNGLAYEKDGALWFRSTDFGDDKDRVVVKNDGEFTYFASDIAYHKEKLDRGFDTIIDIWGADHHGYIPRIRAVLKAFGLSEEKFKVILVQIVSLLREGKPVQMSKRSGEFITLREVMDEVGADIAKFIFLTRRSDSHLDFDIEIAKRESSENPVFYVQYAFARISSIFRQVKERNIQTCLPVGMGFSSSTMPEIDLSILKEDDEISLIKKLLHYTMVFEGAVATYEPHRITFYLQELARHFHSYYNKHRVISDDNDLTVARLYLCRSVQIVLEEGLNILGVKAPERM
ncbi:MAG: arginine--tRNA ligase [Thermodesulfovibrionia bacterium]|nr:arginine--tRNA ligase [Thermodesulfovibrionia bacterium]